MAGKRTTPPYPKPLLEAMKDIERRYPGTSSSEFKGVRSTTQAVQSFQDVVAGSALTDKYNNRTLMAAAARVATARYVAYTSKMPMKKKK